MRDDLIEITIALINELGTTSRHVILSFCFFREEAGAHRHCRRQPHQSVAVISQSASTQTTCPNQNQRKPAIYEIHLFKCRLRTFVYSFHFIYLIDGILPPGKMMRVCLFVARTSRFYQISTFIGVFGKF